MGAAGFGNDGDGLPVPPPSCKRKKWESLWWLWNWHKMGVSAVDTKHDTLPV